MLQAAPPVLLPPPDPPRGEKSADSSWTHRLPVSFSPAVAGGAVEQPAAAAGRRPGARRASGVLLRCAAARRTTEDLTPLDAVTARRRALQGRRGGWDEEEATRFSDFPHIESYFDLHVRLGGLVDLDWKWTESQNSSKWVQALRKHELFLWIIIIFKLPFDVYWTDITNIWALKCRLSFIPHWMFILRAVTGGKRGKHSRQMRSKIICWLKQDVSQTYNCVCFFFLQATLWQFQSSSCFPKIEPFLF